ncbi:MAG: DUF4296 domain-containing protein [Bacteroidales bacterium]|jgi:hypothetical protein|nr:DUF4296 domain-containing protein [Bacteroidales bacterium]
MKKFYILGLLLFIILINACGPEPDQTPKPDNMIAQDTLVMMFYDIHLIDASLTTNVVDPRGVYSRYNLYQSMFAKYNRNEDDFNETIRYYVLNDIEVLDDVYDKVLARLNKEQGELTQKLQEDI